MKNLFKNIFLKTIIISWSQVYTSSSCQCFSNPKIVPFCLFIHIPLIRVHIPLTNCLCWLVRGCQQFRKKKKKKKKKRNVKKNCVALIMIIIDLYGLFYNEISICKKFHDSQRHICNPVEHLRWRFFGKISLRHEIFAALRLTPEIGEIKIAAQNTFLAQTQKMLQKYIFYVLVSWNFAN